MAWVAYFALTVALWVASGWPAPEPRLIPLAEAGGTGEVLGGEGATELQASDAVDIVEEVGG